MKKKYLIVGLIDIIIVISGIILINKYNPSEVIKTQEVYLMNYSASHNTYDVLNSVNNFQFIKNLMELEIVIDRAKDNNYDKRYNNNFFKDKALLVIQGLIDSEIYNMKFKIFRAYIDAYTATPLTDPDEECSFDLYFIPIEKTVTHIELNISPYPNRMY